MSFPVNLTRTSQPQVPVGVDRRSRFADKLVYATDGLRIYVPGAETSMANRVATTHGVGGTGNIPASRALPASGTNFTQFALFINIQGTGANYPSIAQCAEYASESSNAGCGFGLRTSAGESRRAAFFVFNNNNQAAYQVTGTTSFTTANQVTSIAGTSSTVGREIYVAGILEASAGAASGMATPTSAFGFGQIDTGGGENTRVMFGALWDRVLSAAEIRELHRNPWQLFTPNQRRILIPELVAIGGAAFAARAPYMKGVLSVKA